jgi:hypothetical protein
MRKFSSAILIVMAASVLSFLSSCTDEFTRNYVADHVYFVAIDSLQKEYAEFHAAHTFQLDKTNPPIDPQTITRGTLVYADVHGSFQNPHNLPDSIALYFTAPNMPLELVAFGTKKENNDSLLTLRTLKDSNLHNMLKQHNVLMIAKAWSKKSQLPTEFGGRFEFEISFEE